ncbi:hypothetical protein MPSEU_000228500 [Mayamaea pseudoterrestris]|nr:hypothetical protein MPSEU_000228500 [Mayamaea pseudoterrestris]
MKALAIRFVLSSLLVSSCLGPTVSPESKSLELGMDHGLGRVHDLCHVASDVSEMKKHCKYTSSPVAHQLQSESPIESEYAPSPQQGSTPTMHGGCMYTRMELIETSFPADCPIPDERAGWHESTILILAAILAGRVFTLQRALDGAIKRRCETELNAAAIAQSKMEHYRDEEMLLSKCAMTIDRLHKDLSIMQKQIMLNKMKEQALGKAVAGIYQRIQIAAAAGVAVEWTEWREPLLEMLDCAESLLDETT